MTPIRAFDIDTTRCRYTMTVYRLEDGRLLAEYCAHDPHPGPLIRVGDLHPASSALPAHQEHYVQTLLANCLAEISRDAGKVLAAREMPVRHAAPGHECADQVI